MSDILESCKDLPEREFGPREPLIEEGAEADLLFILIEGSVRVTKDGTEVARTDEPGAVFGEISALLGTPTSARVEAMGGVRVHVIEEASVRLAGSPELALHTARILARRLVGATAYLADIKRQFADQQNHFGMLDQVLDRLLQQQEKGSADQGASPVDDPRL